MGDKGEGGVKNLKKWVMSFMDGPLRPEYEFEVLHHFYGNYISGA